MPMRKLFLGILLCSHCLPIPFVFGQADLHEWTNRTGQTIQAKFIRGDAETVTLFLNSRAYLYKLSDLSEESQALARKLALSADSSTANPAGQQTVVAGVSLQPHSPAMRHNSGRLRQQQALVSDGWKHTAPPRFPRPRVSRAPVSRAPELNT